MVVRTGAQQPRLEGRSEAQVLEKKFLIIIILNATVESKHGVKVNPYFSWCFASDVIIRVCGGSWDFLERSYETVVGVLGSSSVDDISFTSTSDNDVDSLSVCCNTERTRLSDLWGSSAASRAKLLNYAAALIEEWKGRSGESSLPSLLQLVDFYSLMLHMAESLSHLSSSDNTSAAVHHLLLQTSSRGLRNAKPWWWHNRLCIPFSFPRVLRFYLFLPVHIGFIIFHRRAAARVWADLMSVRGTARRRARDRGRTQASRVITKDGDSPPCVRGYSWRRISAGVPQKRYRRYGRGWGWGGRKDRSHGVFIFFVSRLRNLSCFLLCSAKPAAFV